MPNLLVPHRMQMAIGYCLPACIEMLLAYYGIERTQSDLMSRLTQIGDVGVVASSVLRLASRGLAVQRRRGDLPDLLELLDRRIPAILEVKTGNLPYWSEDTDHALVFSGAEGHDMRDTAIVNDPAFPNAMPVHLGDVLLAWDEHDNYFITLQPIR